MAVSKRIQEIVKDSVDFGISQGLPEFMLFIVYARSRDKKYSGCAIIGAASKKQAKEIAKCEDGWLTRAIIRGVDTFEEYSKRIPMEPDPYELLRINKLMPKKVGDWFELEWG